MVLACILLGEQGANHIFCLIFAISAISKDEILEGSHVIRQLVVIALVLFSVGAEACIWDSDTLRDESIAHPSWFDILIGQFAHHGEPYYRERIERLTAKGALSEAERNDLAVAC